MGSSPTGGDCFACLRRSLAVGALWRFLALSGALWVCSGFFAFLCVSLRFVGLLRVSVLSLRFFAFRWLRCVSLGPCFFLVVFLGAFFFSPRFVAHFVLKALLFSPGDGCIFMQNFQKRKLPPRLELGTWGHRSGGPAASPRPATKIIINRLCSSPPFFWLSRLLLGSARPRPRPPRRRSSRRRPSRPKELSGSNVWTGF